MSSWGWTVVAVTAAVVLAVLGFATSARRSGQGSRRRFWWFIAAAAAVGCIAAIGAFASIEASTGDAPHEVAAAAVSGPTPDPQFCELRSGGTPPAQDAFVCTYFYGAISATEVDAAPGQVLNLVVVYRNFSGERRDNVTFTLEPLDRVTMVPGAIWTNSNHPGGLQFDETNLLSPGLNLGSYEPKADAWISLPLQVADASHFSCGDTALTVRASAGSWNGSRPVSSAVIRVTKRC